jgi:murein DD-endopeptidase MepM/ murein hydrolase activator NlpD
MNQPFSPYRGSPLAGTAIERIFNRYLTPVSIGVVLIGLILVAIGPVRAYLTSIPSTAPNTGGPASTTNQPQSLAILTSDSGVVTWEVDRQLLPFTIIPDRPRNTVVTYTVKPGDTLFEIAAHFGIDPKTIFWSNAVLEDNVHMLQPGIDLAIPPSDGVYFTADGAQSIESAAAFYKGDANEIINSQYNELAGYKTTDVPPWGMKVFVPGGERELSWGPPPVVETTDVRTGTVVRGFMPGMGGTCASFVVPNVGTGAWVLPAQSYMVTQPFYPGHSGIDLGAPIGTPSYAADTGVVIFSGWNNWGYGILVVLDHGNGFTSYYAHLNSRSVGCGETVTRGQYIGQIGTTGQSSGPHLHFEIRWGHTPTNPAAYIGF